MGHEKLAVNCFLAKIIGSLKAKHPRLTASTSFPMVHAARSNRSSLFVNLIFLQGLYTVSIQQNFFATSYGKSVIERLEVTRSVLSPKLSGLVMMHWRYRSCVRQSFTNVPTFSLPMWTSHGLSPVKWCEFSPNQLGITATITASMS